MADPELPLPVEVPWKLASTTQPLSATGPEETTISLFHFEPAEKSLTSLFPDQRLIYLKFTVSVSPATIPNAPPVAALGEGVPCLHLVMDLAVRTGSGQLGNIRPYFHTAAPTHRTMVQTGMVGADAFEGEADMQAMGRSGSQMYESSSSGARTTSAGLSAGFGIGPFSVGGSVRTTSTDITASRSVSQQIDTTQRQASQERRELVSHMTHVENVLTLLNAKYVGTPYVRFSLSPQPLQLLSIDPADPNLWFSQLLTRRSSGVEGLQEFTTIVLVPKDEDFCVNAALRHLHWMTTEDPRTTISINKLSGGLRYRLRPLGEEPGRDVTTSAARLEEIARRFLDQLGRPDQPLVLDRITYLHMETTAPNGSLLARSTLDAGLVFTRTVDDLPVVGPGGIAMVKIGTDETVVGGREIWRPIVRRGPKLKLRTPEESIELLGRRLTASGVDGVVYVSKARLGYNELGIEEEQRYLEPCYAFVIVTSGALVDWKKVVVIPAAIGRPASLTEPAAGGSQV